MTECEVINYMRQICDGLKHMHENSIVHLDVKVSQSQCVKGAFIFHKFLELGCKENAKKHLIEI